MRKIGLVTAEQNGLEPPVALDFSLRGGGCHSAGGPRHFDELDLAGFRDGSRSLSRSEEGAGEDDFRASIGNAQEGCDALCLSAAFGCQLALSICRRTVGCIGVTQDVKVHNALRTRYMTMPPSTVRHCPVMYFASALARNATAAAMSAGCPKLPRGI
ncbi:MAG: hypothetical protein RIS92_3027 [Verrucomicrobiota bacterium]